MFRLQACQKGRGIAIQLANPPLSLMGSLYQGLKTQVKERVLAIHQGRLLAIQGCHVGLKTHNPKQLATLCQGAQKNTMTQRFEIYVFFFNVFFHFDKTGLQIQNSVTLYRSFVPLWHISGIPLRSGWEVFNGQLFWTETNADATTTWILGS